MRRHPAFDRITFDETPIRAAANTPENERKMTVKTQKRVLIYGICYFLVFILLSAIAPIARDGLTRENTTAEGKKEPENASEKAEGAETTESASEESEDKSAEDKPAEDKPTEPEDTLSYRIDGGTVVITGVSDNCVSLIIPEKIDGYVVSAIEEGAFAGARGLVEAVLPDTVTYVGEKAFCDCIALTSVTLSNGLTEICYGTFSNCSALKSVYIPESVSMIGDCAFDGCVSLQEITLPKRLKSLGKEVLIEGVETEDRAELFKNFKIDFIQGCEYLQGFYFSRPLPQTEFVKFLTI